jgi:RNA polymerase sigma factor (sigma-70 family)
MKGSASSRWELFLVAYLSGGCDFTTLYSAAWKPLVRIVARLAPLMPEDLREDVVQEAFTRLIQNPPKYTPGQYSARTLTYGLLRNAIKHVRSTFTPPGQKTRVPDSGTEQSPPELTAQRRTVEDLVTPEDLDQAPSPRWTASTVEAFAQSHELLDRMPDDVGTATWLVYGLESPIVDAAKTLGISRFAVARSLILAQRMARLEIDASQLSEGPRAGFDVHRL